MCFFGFLKTFEHLLQMHEATQKVEAEENKTFYYLFIWLLKTSEQNVEY